MANSWLTPLHRCPTLHKASRGWPQALRSCAVCHSSMLHSRRQPEILMTICTSSCLAWDGCTVPCSAAEH